MAGSSHRISVTAEVVGIGSDGTEPSLLFSVQRHGLYSDDVKVLKRYLFNCGEGTQRLAGENGIKLSSLDAMYLTRFDFKSVSGVPGVIFALGSCGAATLKLHGPVGLGGFLGAIRSFVRRKYPQIQCVEIVDSSCEERVTARDGAESIEFEQWKEGVERTDQHALIIPISLGSGAVRSKSCMLCEKNAPKREPQDESKEAGSKESSASAANIQDSQIGRRGDSESDEHEYWRSWLLQYYTVKVPAKVPYVDVVLNRYRGRYDDLKAQLCAKYGDVTEDKSLSSETAVRDSCSSSESSSDSESDDNDAAGFEYAERPLDRRWLEKFYAEHQPEKLSHIDRVLRQFSGREDNLKQMLLKKYGGNDTSTTRRSAVTDESTPQKKRKLVHNGNRCDDNIPKIQADENCLDGRHSSSLDDAVGSTNPICYIIQFQYAPHPVVWLIDCSTPDHLSDLACAFSGYCGSHFPSLVVHLSPPNVQAQPRYKQWMESLGSFPSPPEQLVFNGTTLQSVAHGAFSYAFVSSAKAAVRKELQIRSTTTTAESKTNQSTTPAIQDLANILKNASWSADSPYQRRIIQRLEGCDREIHVAQSKLQFRLMHPKEPRLGFSYERTGWHQKRDQVQDDDGDDNKNDSVGQQLNTPSSACFQGDIDTTRKLIVLGTGSAAPSKLRASSGIYMELSGTNAADVESMLVDCGEGTFGQLWRQFGSDVTQRIGGLRCIWISHNHADHHCGLVRVLYEYWYFQTHRNNGDNPQPLVVVAPQSVLSYVESWLPRILGKTPDHELFRLATCSDFNLPRHPLRQQLLSEISYAVASILSVRVFHCYDSYGLVLTLKSGKKLVYSGDTKPCNDLVLAGLGAELVVHEATFDDSMEEDAVKKKHSTVSQALDIARRMRARQVVLTHFSQRYPSLPPPVAVCDNSTPNVLCAYDGFVHPMPF
ncbi:hypothetical protein PF008_g16868 [Phytophthora fragariae]|uniref:ribonuclease Z n=1 Tax=Phytophthora fragariae TaxID=53985 RepID=A0A6G0RBA1_9STRA|nr:hypothetical protein PF008_g16868 [Phytophthora fragariae]